MSERPVIYQVLPRLFGNRQAGANVPGGTLEANGCGKMSAFTPAVLKRLKNTGYNYIWYTGLLRHATQTSYPDLGIPQDNPAVVKGRAGSPYAISDYYDIDPDLADNPARRHEEFDDLIRRTHHAGLKVVMDFVPNHVARQYRSVCAPPEVRDLGADDNLGQAFSPQNNFYYIPGQRLHTDNFAAGADYKEDPARVTGNNCFHAFPSRNDWYETVKLNYGVDYVGGHREYFNPVPSTWQKMTHILLHWAERGADAFRCDMAEMVPVAFWEYAIAAVKEQHPDKLFIAEVYDPSRYRDYLHRGGFDYLYDKVGLYDTLRGVVEGHRPAADITRCWQATDDIADRMLHFLENHDEQRIASDYFAGRADAGLPAFFTAALMNRAAVMVYAGEEVGEAGMEAEGFSGQDGRTTIFDYWRVDKLNRLARGLTCLKKEERTLYDRYAAITSLCTQHDTVREGGFYDLTYVNFDHPQTFDAARQYAFLRTAAGKGTLLCVANFDALPREAEVRIPAHAFDFAGLEGGTREAKDLLSGKVQRVSLIPDGLTQVVLPGYDGVVLEL